MKRIIPTPLPFFKSRGSELNLTLLISLMSCGKSEKALNDHKKETGFFGNYNPPVADYNDPDNDDPNFERLKPVYEDPYWLGALIMDQGEVDVGNMLTDNNRVMLFSFPVSVPSYNLLSISGWAPANEEIILASRDILEKLEEVLDVEFKESVSSTGYNVLAIAQSIQVSSSGFSFFPNNYFEIGSDVFISKSYAAPKFIATGLTNYDYEVLVHEIGHALGLKHPFEADRNNKIVLDVYEDQTKFTAMSYTDNALTFDGTFRPLDWVALTQLYGVNKSYRPEDDVYYFSESSAVFIIDGNGKDAIDASNSLADIYIDLRPGSHCYEGEKSDYITFPKQLTISHGTLIEEVKTGSGNDYVIGNQYSNSIFTSDGDDWIFPGLGPDFINAGTGVDLIDLSEEISSIDIVDLHTSPSTDDFDVIFGFEQGVEGDCLNVGSFVTELSLLPLVEIENVPEGFITNGLLRIVGNNITKPNNLENEFIPGGRLNGLDMSDNSYAFIISSESQDTGEEQNMFLLTKSSGDFDVSPMTKLIGNSLDIDMWTTDNFIL